MQMVSKILSENLDSQKCPAIYSFSNNFGSGTWLCLQGNYAEHGYIYKVTTIGGPISHFHDYGRKGISY